MASTCLHWLNPCRTRLGNSVVQRIQLPSLPQLANHSPPSSSVRPRTASVCPPNTPSNLPGREMDHSRIVLSAEAVSTRPSSTASIAQTDCSCRPRVVVHCPFFHILRRALPDDRIVIPGSGQREIIGPPICGRSRPARDATYL